VATVLLIRHGRSSANTEGILAGRSPGVHLDDTGRSQAEATGVRVGALALAAIVTSPLERCRETASALVKHQAVSIRPHIDRRFTECGYGAWTGQQLKQLAKQALWKTVQQHPSAVSFPDGESMVDMQRRAVVGVRAWDQRLQAEHGPDAVWAVVSHADVLKAVLAEALGMHLDMFQRIIIDPGSVSVVRFTPLRPFVLRQNDSGSDLSTLRPPVRRRRGRAASDAPVGGGAGPADGAPPAVSAPARPTT
jgi:probable phosphomutase (TIGR03848 family)